MFKDGTQLHDAFTLGAGERKEDLVVGYWRKSIAHNVKVLQIGKKEIWIEMGGIKIAGVYRKGEEGVTDIQEWIASCEEIGKVGPRLTIGDWNAHHSSWAMTPTTTNTRGRYLAEGMQHMGLQLAGGPKTPTFKRGTHESRIDLVFKSTEVSCS